MPDNKQNVSFAVDLLTGFEHVCKYTEDGLKQLKDVITAFKKRQALELEYAKGLAKLASSFKAIQLGETGDEPPTGSLNLAWQHMLDEMLETAAHHDRYANSLAAQVADPLQAGHKDLEAKRKQLVTDGQRRNKLLQEAYSALNKAQASHQQCQKEADEIKESCEKAKHNLLAKDSTVSKLESKASVADDKAQVAFKLLQDLEEHCDHLQSEHFETHMPDILASLETTEVLRCSKLLTCLSFASKITEDTASKILERAKRSTELLAKTGIRTDIEHFISTVEDVDLPVTSILQPTIKGHLDCRFLESSKWKDQVFVLVAEQRRLYHYDSENSMHPKGVLTLPYGNRIVRPVDDSLFEKAYSFQLVLPTTTYFLSAADRQTMESWRDALRNLCAKRRTKSAAGHRVVRSATVRVVEAKDLPKSGDYYCTVLLGNEEYQARTLTKTNTTTPFWAQTFFLDDIPEDFTTVTIQVCRASGGLLRGMIPSTAKQQAATLKRKLITATGKQTSGLRRAKTIDEGDEPAAKGKLGDIVGTVTKPLSAQHSKETWTEIVSTSPEDTGPTCGTIRMSVQYTDEYIRAAAEYGELEKLLLNCDTDCIKVLDSAITPVDRVSFVDNLLKLASARNKVPEILLALCRVEVEGTSDPNTLFRGNSLASKALDQFMKFRTIHDGKYLTHTLGAAVNAVFDLKTSCEVDPTRIDSSDPSKEIAQNMRRLLAQTALTWNSVMHSLGTLPEDLKYIFAHLAAMVAEKFPGPDAKQSVIAGFFFLRLICPAILGPQLFGLCSVIPTDQTARTFTLISKTIQNLANGVLFGAKEQYMMPMNEFLAEHKPEMEQCLQKLFTTKLKVKPLVNMGEVDDARVLAACQRILEKSSQGLESAREAHPKHAQAVISTIKQLSKPISDAAGEVQPQDSSNSLTPDVPRRRRKSPAPPPDNTALSPKATRRQAPSPRPSVVEETNRSDGQDQDAVSVPQRNRRESTASRVSEISPEDYAARRTSEVPDFLFSDAPPPTSSSRASMIDLDSSRHTTKSELMDSMITLLEGDQEYDEGGNGEEGGASSII